MAQFGVIFLLFALGLEFSTTKVSSCASSSFFICSNCALWLTSQVKAHIPQFQLRVVRAVAVLGGLLQIVLFMFLCGITAMVFYLLVLSEILYDYVLLGSVSKCENHVLPYIH